MNRFRPGPVFVGVSVSVLTAAGVVFALSAGARKTDPPESDIGPVPTISDWRDISLPLDSYEQGNANRKVVLRAEYAQTKACMTEFGLVFDAPAWDTAGPSVGPANPHYRLYGLLDIDHARRWGYGNPGSTPVLHTDSSPEDASSDYFTVLTGSGGDGNYNGKAIPSGGCVGQARSGIEGDADFDLPSRLSAAAWAAQSTDSRVVKAFGSWSACMGQAGYSYATPMDANNDSRWDGDSASPDEIAVAVADVKCKLGTNLVGIRMAVDAAYERIAIQENDSALQIIRSELSRQVVRADDVLAEQG